MDTRILSVFNLLRRVGFAFLLLGACSSSHAQQILWERDGEGDSSRYGREILPLGDQNLDGFDDFAVQAMGAGREGLDQAKLEFFHGGNPPSTTPYLTIDTPPSLSWAYDIWTLDFNGDDFEDIMIPGNPVRIYFGGPDADTTADVVWDGQRPDNQVGKQPLGDFNGDGFDDFYRHDYITGGGDSTEFFWGGVPLDTIPDMVMHSGLMQRALPRTFGDLNGDEVDDFITAVYGGNTTRLYVFLGSNSPDTLPEQEVSVVGTHVHIDIVPDLNGDGKDDLILFGGSGLPGDYHVFLGGGLLSSEPDFNLESGCELRLDDARNYGPEISGAGDYNSDGINDLLIVGPNCPNWGIGSLYLGYHWLNADPVWTIWGREGPYDLIGIRFAAGVGDVNNDGFDDVALGAFNSDFDGIRGRVVVLAGQAMQVAADEEQVEIPSEFNISIFPNPFNSTLSISLDVPLHQEVMLSLYDLLGREVDVVYRGRLALSTISYVAPAAMASGVYFLRAVSGEQSELVKVVLLK